MSRQAEYMTLKPRIFFRDGLWRALPPPPHWGEYSVLIDRCIKAAEFCNYLNKVGRDNYQP